jgi:hypothetical protein
MRCKLLVVYTLSMALHVSIRLESALSALQIKARIRTSDVPVENSTDRPVVNNLSLRL